MQRRSSSRSNVVAGWDPDPYICLSGSKYLYILVHLDPNFHIQIMLVIIRYPQRIPQQCRFWIIISEGIRISMYFQAASGFLKILWRRHFFPFKETFCLWLYIFWWHCMYKRFNLFQEYENWSLGRFRICLSKRLAKSWFGTIQKWFVSKT